MTQRYTFPISKRIVLLLSLEVMRRLELVSPPEMYLDEMRLVVWGPGSRLYKVLFPLFGDRSKKYEVWVDMVTGPRREGWMGGHVTVLYNDIAGLKFDDLKFRARFNVAWSEEGVPTVQIEDPD